MAREPYGQLARGVSAQILAEVLAGHSHVTTGIAVRVRTPAQGPARTRPRAGDRGRDAAGQGPRADSGPIHDRPGGTISALGAAARVVGQVGLGAALIGAGTLHLTSGRKAFRAQVPSWLPADPDLVVLVSGGVELGLGGALLVVWPQPARAVTGLATAAFFVGIFPGNIAQLVERRNAFGLDH